MTIRTKCDSCLSDLFALAIASLGKAPMQTNPIDDAHEDLKDALEAFKMTPSADTLDDVFRATTAIEMACREQVRK